MKSAGTSESTLVLTPPFFSCKIFLFCRLTRLLLPNTQVVQTARSAREEGRNSCCLPARRQQSLRFWRLESPLQRAGFCGVLPAASRLAREGDLVGLLAASRAHENCTTHFREKIIVAGGYDGRNRLNVVETFTPPDARCPQGQWTELADMKEPRAFFALLTSTDDAIFALGDDASSSSSSSFALH
ncbi:Kelch-like protein 18 [Sparganum proliferum]